MRLIDADAYMEKVCTYKETGCGCCVHQGYCPVDEPTIEAKEVVHGKWVYDENANDWGIGGWCCSECGCKNDNLGCDTKIPVHWFAGSKFCPQCGADMRGKKRE